jgi:N utilization substance protein B
MSVVDVLRSLPVRPDPFTVELVIGVAEQAGEIDRLISGSALGWDLGRMPWVDLALLRIATYELVATATPVAVVIDEAVELAKEYSTEDSPRFVNGVLSSIAAVSRG